MSSNPFKENINVTVAINAIIFRSIALFHTMYLLGINSFEIRNFFKWKLQKQLRFSVSLLCFFALISNFTTFILRSLKWTAELDTQLNVFFSNLCQILDVIYNTCFNGCLLLLVICSMDRYKRIVLSDHEIGLMRAQASASIDNTNSQTPVLKRRLWLNIIVGTLVVLFVVYVVGLTAATVYSIIIQQPYPSLYATLLNGIIGFLLVFEIFFEYGLNLAMVFCVTKNIASHPRFRRHGHSIKSEQFRSGDEEGLHSCATDSWKTRWSLWFRSLENQMLLKIGSALSLIFVTDVISLALVILFSVKNNDTNSGILHLFIPSIVTLHIHASFYLFDYLLVCVNDIKHQVRLRIADLASSAGKSKTENNNGERRRHGTFSNSTTNDDRFVDSNAPSCSLFSEVSGLESFRSSYRHPHDHQLQLYSAWSPALGSSSFSTYKP